MIWGNVKTAEAFCRCFQSQLRRRRPSSRNRGSLRKNVKRPHLSVD